MSGCEAGLSAEGRLRRERMRAELLAVFDRHHRRRRTRRATAIAVAGLALVVTALRFLPVRPGPSPRRAVRFAVVETRERWERYLVPTRTPSRVRVLDDDELLDLLERAGHRSGLVRVAGEARLVGWDPEPH